jgi:hypothetical protein
MDINQHGQIYKDIPCGHCLSCRIADTRSWCIRMEHEARNHVVNSFVTLTYADGYLPVGGTLVKEHAKNFFKNFRQRIKVRVRYFLCGEYGELYKRPHYHAILFGVGLNAVAAVERSWPYGFTSLMPVKEGAYRYVAGYVQKTDSRDYRDGRQPPFRLMSRMPGIGYGFVSRYPQSVRHPVYPGTVLSGGKRVPAPLYYINKVFSQEEKEALKNDRILLERPKLTDAQFLESPLRKLNYAKYYEHEYAEKLKMVRRV